jgi:hypothetical protein
MTDEIVCPGLSRGYTDGGLIGLAFERTDRRINGSGISGMRRVVKEMIVERIDGIRSGECIQ